MIEQKNDRKINRGTVHVVGHDYNSVLWVNENAELFVKLEQIEVWTEAGKLKKFARKSFIAGEWWDIIERNYFHNLSLPGNIRIIEQLSPPIPDEPEECLYWKEDKSAVERDFEGNVIYRYQSYFPTENWSPAGEIDEIVKR